MATHETFILRHSSMQHTDPDWQRRKDAIDAFRPGKGGLPDVVGFTELGGSKGYVSDAAEDAGYRLITRASVGLAIHSQLKVREVQWTEVLPAQGGLKHGNYETRGVLAVTMETLGGNIVTVHEAHWITDAKRNPLRASKRESQSEAMVGAVRRNSQGSRIGFWMGDTNSDERRDEGDEVQGPLTRGKLRSVYDELKTFPRTHGRKTIDVIGRFLRDRRVKALWVKVYGDRYSDHRKVDAAYRIRAKR